MTRAAKGAAGGALVVTFAVIAARSGTIGTFIARGPGPPPPASPITSAGGANDTFVPAPIDRSPRELGTDIDSVPVLDPAVYPVLPRVWAIDPVPLDDASREVRVGSAALSV